MKEEIAGNDEIDRRYVAIVKSFTIEVTYFTSLQDLLSLLKWSKYHTIIRNHKKLGQRHSKTRSSSAPATQDHVFLSGRPTIRGDFLCINFQFQIFPGIKKHLRLIN
jgi:hypothetical protein